MQVPRKRTPWFLSVLLVSGAFFSQTAFGVDTKANPRWSISFENVTVAEALNQLAQKTRVKINTEGSPLDSKVSKTYRNRDIDGIIRDLLKNVNYTSVWTYGEKGLDTIHIRVFEKTNGRSSERYPPPEDRRITPPVPRQHLPQPPPQPARRISPYGGADAASLPERSGVDQEQEDDKDKAEEGTEEKEDSKESQEDEKEKESEAEKEAEKGTPKEQKEAPSTEKETSASEEKKQPTASQPSEGKTQ